MNRSSEHFRFSRRAALVLSLLAAMHEKDPQDRAVIATRTRQLSTPVK